MGYRIKTVSELTGIPKNTIVAWERRYGVLDPQREANGYRVYSQADIAVLERLKSALGTGLKISEAVDLVRRRSEHEAPAATQTDAYQSLQRELLDALGAFERDRADAVAAKMVNTPYVVALDEVYFPLLREVGERWASGAFSVAQEHFAAAFVRDQLTGMLQRLGFGPAGGRRVACATFPGEHHELGALGLAVRLASDGYRVIYLGADLPLEDLLHAATSVPRSQAPEWICVSLISPVASEPLAEYACALRQGFSGRITIGGSGLPDDLPDIEGVRFARDYP